jgi:hypothetical protein
MGRVACTEMCQGGSLMRIAGLIALTLGIAGCARFQPTSASINPNPTAVLQSATLKDTAVHYDPSVMRPGVARSEVEATFGPPNSSGHLENGEPEDIYAFYPDGTKFVNPTVRPRNVALGVFTGGVSVAVRQLRLRQAEKKLTLYHVVYGSDETVALVRIEAPPDAKPAVSGNRAPPERSTIGKSVE